MCPRVGSDDAAAGIGVSGGSDAPCPTQPPVLVMIAHGFLAALTFGLSGYLRQQTDTLEIKQLGGLLRRLPFVGAALIMAISWVESDVGMVNRSCRVRRTLASSLVIGCVSLKSPIARRQTLLRDFTRKL